MAIIGATSLTLLPIVLELAVELTRNADGSSALLWLSYVLSSHLSRFRTRARSRRSHLILFPYLQDKFVRSHLRARYVCQHPARAKSALTVHHRFVLPYTPTSPHSPHLHVVLNVKRPLHTHTSETPTACLVVRESNRDTLHAVPVEGALRAGPDANPPLNMHRAVIFQAALVASAVAFVYGVEGKQTRRAQDEVKRDQAAHHHHHPHQRGGTGVEVVEVPADGGDDAHELAQFVSDVDSESRGDLEKGLQKAQSDESSPLTLHTDAASLTAGDRRRDS